MMMMMTIIRMMIIALMKDMCVVDVLVAVWREGRRGWGRWKEMWERAKSGKTSQFGPRNCILGGLDQVGGYPSPRAGRNILLGSREGSFKRRKCDPGVWWVWESVEVWEMWEDQ